MDAKTKDAINNVRKFAALNDALQTIVGAFDELASAQQVVDENKQVVAKLKKEASKIALGIENTKDKAAEILAEAKDTAQKVINAAEQEAGEILATAKKQAESANEELKKVKTRVADAIHASDKEIEALGEQKSALSGEIKTLEKKLAGLRDQAAAFLKV